MSHDSKVVPVMRGRLVLVAERYGTPRVLLTTAAQELGYPAKASSSVGIFSMVGIARCPEAPFILQLLERRAGLASQPERSGERGP